MEYINERQESLGIGQNDLLNIFDIFVEFCIKMLSYEDGGPIQLTNSFV